MTKIINQFGVFATFDISKEKLQELYWKKGLSQNEIARLYHVDGKTVSQKMKKYVIPVRGRKGQKRGGVPRVFYGTKEEVAALYAKGLTTAELASHFHISRRTMEEWMRSFEIKIRDRSERVKGKRNPFFGRSHTSQTKQKISDCNTGRTWKDDANRVAHHTKVVKERWRNPKYRARNIAALRKSWKQKPTKPELLFQKICAECDFPLIYVGDGHFSVNGFNPDFIDATGRHLAVEIFGDYWHSPDRKGIPSYMLEANRKAIFKKYGWDLIVIWEHELASFDNIIKKLRCVYANIIVSSRN